MNMGRDIDAVSERQGGEEGRREKGGVSGHVEICNNTATGERRGEWAR